MPTDTPNLTSFLRRDGQDKIMFGWIQCMQQNLPGVSIEKAIAQFAAHYGLKDLNVVSQATRYQRMRQEFWADKKSETAKA